jgi:hypothetical protein
MLFRKEPGRMSLRVRPKMLVSIVVVLVLSLAVAGERSVRRSNGR